MVLTGISLIGTVPSPRGVRLVTQVTVYTTAHETAYVTVKGTPYGIVPLTYQSDVGSAEVYISTHVLFSRPHVSLFQLYRYLVTPHF